jgi:catechol O-methyltransferase
MQLWRFLQPSALGFTLKTTSQALLDKIKGAPARPVQAARYVARNARAGDPEDILRILDQFAQQERWLMSVGPKKGPLIRELAQRLPANARILELGAYCGYSSIMIANAFGPAARITSIEIDQNAVASSRANVEYAGLSDRITFVHGPSTKMIATLEGRFDLVFLDHWKDLYKSDLQLIEQRHLIGPGSIVVADNVGKIFAPEVYLDYVRNCGHYDCEHREATIEYTSVPDAVEISVYRSG